MFDVIIWNIDVVNITKLPFSFERYDLEAAKGVSERL